jgi:branched-subunit amino acid ABC-type transport system permease component
MFSWSFLAVAVLNGLSYGMLLFLISAGLTVILGLMNFVNLAHGSLFMLGAYVALSVMHWSGNFAVAAGTAALAVLAGGIVLERFLLRPLYRRGFFDQVLLTFAIVLILSDLVRRTWGPAVLSIPEPPALSGSIHMFDVTYPMYRLFVAGFGFAVAVPLLCLQRYTLYGAILRASVADQEMASGLGINIRRVFSIVFGLGAFLAGLGGALGGPMVGLYPGMDTQWLIFSQVVIVLGGMGSVLGSFCGSIVIGLATSFGNALMPRFSLFLVFGIMAIVLLVRPQGLFGKRLV